MHTLLLLFALTDSLNTDALLRAVNADLASQVIYANTVQQAQIEIDRVKRKATEAHKAAEDLIATEALKCPSKEIDRITWACKAEVLKK